MRHVRLFSVLLLACLVRPAPAAELPEVVGHVRSVRGEAFFVSRGEANAAHVGQAVLRGGTLRTGADGTLGVTLDDGSRLALGPQSELRLERFLYEPAKGHLRVGLWLARGTLVLAGGEVARLAPGQMRLDTPLGAVGVLGEAEVLVRVVR